MVEVTKQSLMKGEPMIIKWSGSPYPQDPASEYALNSGWRLPDQMDHFFHRLDEQTSIINEATLIRMKELDLDIDYLRTKLRLNDIRRLKDYTPDAGTTPGSQIQDIYAFDESTPDFNRNALHAVRTVAYTTVPQTFLDENLEKSNFLSITGSMYMAQLGLEIERQCQFAIKNPARPHGRSSMDSLDGIFQQLKYVEHKYQTGTGMPKGMGSAVSTANGSLIHQLQDKIREYIEQNGNTKHAKFYISNILYNQLLQEVSQRETNRGDSVYWDGSKISVLGTQIDVVDFLNPLKPEVERNGWGHMGMLCDPRSIAYGVYKDIESRTTYEHSTLSYLTDWQVSFDTLLIWEQDVLGFEVIDGKQGSFVFSVVDASKSVVEGAEISIFNPKARDPDTPIVTPASTNANGVVQFDGISYGKYTVKITHPDYKDKVINDVILNEDLELQTIKLTKS